MTAATSALVVSAAVFSATPVSIIGHFKLIEPASWLIESDRGDPQKTGLSAVGAGAGKLIERIAKFRAKEASRQAKAKPALPKKGRRAR